MPKLIKSTLVAAPVDRVFAFMRNPANWMGVYPGVEVHEVTLTPEGVGTRFTWSARTFGIHVSGTHEYTEFLPNQRIISVSSKGFVYTWTFEPDFEGTKLTLELQDIPNNWIEAALDTLLMKLTEQELDDWIVELDEEVEAREQPRPPQRPQDSD